MYYCALFNQKFIKCKSIGINVSAVTIYIRSLTITVLIHASPLEQPVAAVCVFNRNTSVYICIHGPLFSSTKHNLHTQTVKCSLNFLLQGSKHCRKISFRETCRNICLRSNHHILDPRSVQYITKRIAFVLHFSD